MLIVKLEKVATPWLVVTDSVPPSVAPVGLLAKAMLTVLLMKMQENDFSHETMRDLVGEVANTISGNARRDFGRDFVISVPSVLSGEKPTFKQKPGQRSFIIPINWRSHSAKLVVSLT